jgi:hypothetical protein
MSSSQEWEKRDFYKGSVFMLYNRQGKDYPFPWYLWIQFKKLTLFWRVTDPQSSISVSDFLLKWRLNSKFAIPIGLQLAYLFT